VLKARIGLLRRLLEAERKSEEALLNRRARLFADMAPQSKHMDFRPPNG
jgi:hypothetical protein